VPCMSSHLGGLAASIIALSCAGCVHAPKLMSPACADPVPISGHYDREAPEFWTVVPDREVAAAVANDYGLTLAFEGSSVITFPVTIDPALLARLRCDERIHSIWNSPDLPDTEFRCDDDLGGFRWEGEHLLGSSSSRQLS
jgi:hypothetical protein